MVTDDQYYTSNRCIFSGNCDGDLDFYKFIWYYTPRHREEIEDGVVYAVNITKINFPEKI